MAKHRGRDNLIPTNTKRSERRAEKVREAQRLKSQGLTQRQIAAEMGINERTITKYINDPTGKKAIVKQRLRDGRIPRNVEEAIIVFNKMDLPITQKMRMRPVWKRRQQRIYGQNRLKPPTEAEKHDAILVLADRTTEKHAPALWLEAFRIFEETSE